MASGKKYWAGQVCEETGLYGQYDDKDDSYAGSTHDRHVDRGERFPPTLNNHHYQKK